MSLLSDRDLQHAMDQGAMAVEPRHDGRIQPSSIDLTLADEYIRLPHMLAPLDPYDKDSYCEHKWKADSITLQPGDFVLAATAERVTLGNLLAARVEGKSSLGRLGLIVHTTAGFIDPGFSGNITLELANLLSRPIVLTAGMPIAQLAVFRLTTGSYQGYNLTGKYTGSASTGPVASRYYMNSRPEKERSVHQADDAVVGN